MKRREWLVVVGAGAGALAGCLGSPRGESTASPTGTPSPTSTPATETQTATPTPARTRRLSMGESMTVGGVRATVENPRVRKAVRGVGVHDPRLVSGPGQFVVVDIVADGATDPVDDGQFDAALDGTGVSTDPTPIFDTESTYAFPVPVRSADRGSIRWTPGEATIHWEFPRSVTDALAAEPRFRVEEFALPRREDELVLALTVVNEGDRPGLFRASVTFDAFTGRELVAFEVPAGERRQYSGRADGIVLYFENNGGGTFALTYPGDDGLDRLERTVSVSETPTESQG